MEVLGEIFFYHSRTGSLFAFYTDIVIQQLKRIKTKLDTEPTPQPTQQQTQLTQQSQLTQQQSQQSQQSQQTQQANTNESNRPSPTTPVERVKMKMKIVAM
jgi:hypothetical protein